MRCTACGTENAPERRFCADCGAGLAIACASLHAANEARRDSAASAVHLSTGRQSRRASPRPASPWPAGERRQLTLLFCDLCQSTALSDRLDPEDMREVLEAYRQRCAAALDPLRRHRRLLHGRRHPGLFRLPDRARGRRGARGARGARDRAGRRQSGSRAGREPLPLPLQVRIAVHTGLVVAGEIGVDSRRSELWAVGKAPNIAARLQILAAPDSIVVSDATHRLLHGVFDSTLAGPPPSSPASTRPSRCCGSRASGRRHRDARRRGAHWPRRWSTARRSWPSSRTAGPTCGRAKAEPCCCPASRASASRGWCARWSPAYRRPAIGSSCCNARPTSPTARSIR